MTWIETALKSGSVLTVNKDDKCFIATITRKNGDLCRTGGSTLDEVLNKMDELLCEEGG